VARPQLGYDMRHVALDDRGLAACERFYVDLPGMEAE
jgi:hypothetical protein